MRAAALTLCLALASCVPAPRDCTYPESRPIGRRYVWVGVVVSGGRTAIVVKVPVQRAWFSVPLHCDAD